MLLKTFLESLQDVAPRRLMALLRQILSHRIPEHRLELSSFPRSHLLQRIEDFGIGLRGKLSQCAHHPTIMKYLDTSSYIKSDAFKGRHYDLT